MGGNQSVSRSAVNMNGEVAQYVKDLIKEHNIIMFSKSYCPYCKIAKKSFDELKADYKVIDLNSHQDGSEIQDVLDLMTGSRTVPRVFVGGNCIGGGSETRDLLISGKLKELIESTK